MPGVLPIIGRFTKVFHTDPGEIEGERKKIENIPMALLG